MSDARFVCRQCGCYWRKNTPTPVQPDGSWSLYDAAQRPCLNCDNAPGFLAIIRPAPVAGYTLGPYATPPERAELIARIQTLVEDLNTSAFASSDKYELRRVGE